MPAKRSKLVVVLGPTSVGKTKLAVKLAKAFGGEIVSADSRQVYKGMDIGTGKDLKEYGPVPYHLIDVASPKTRFNLSDYQQLAYQAIEGIIKRKKVPFLVGGSGLYLQSVIDGYNLSQTPPRKYLREFLNFLSLSQLQRFAKKEKLKLNESDFNNKRRLIRKIEMAQGKKTRPSKKARYDCLQIGLAFPKEELAERIDRRLEHRLNKEGLVEEVKKLHSNGVSWQRLDDFGLEYRFVAKYLQKELPYGEMVNKLKTASHQFAKRQLTWFKRDKRINWVKNEAEAKKLIEQFLRP